MKTDLEVIHAEGNETVQGDAGAAWLRRVRLRAGQLHRLYTKACNEELTPHDKRNEATLERELRELFSGAGVGLYLNGDPRGSPVGIITAKTGAANTLGGDWRL